MDSGVDWDDEGDNKQQKEGSTVAGSDDAYWGDTLRPIVQITVQITNNSQG